MAKRPVHWSEGMFITPHHFQAAERYFRDRVREAEDWLHPHNWGFRSLNVDADAVANYSLVLRSCQARFKDGTTVSVPDESTVAPVDLRAALANASETTVYLAVPTVHANRANVEAQPTAAGPRYVTNTVECVDENTGSDEAPIEFRLVQARLLPSHAGTTGYEVLPLARITRSSGENSAPQVDPTFVPPVLGMDVWTPLHEDVRSLYEQINAWITQEADLLVDRKIAFDSQVLGDADRVLRLSCLNTAFSFLQAVVPTRGVHPQSMYEELCRLLGQLSIFGERRRPIDVAGYDHENIGPVYARVIREIRRLLGEPGRVAYTKRYFEFDSGARSFRVALDPAWVPDSSKVYIGVETVELSDAECDDLLKKSDWKLASGEKVEEIYRAGEVGLSMKPLNRIPPALPAGVVYFDVNRDPTYWRDVARSHSLGLRFKKERCQFLSKSTVALTHPETKRTVNLQFAVFAV